MELTVRRVKGGNGERHAILVDESGVPLFYPTLWVTVILRGGSQAVNTIQNALNALKCLYAWQAAYALDIEQRFSSGNLLAANEVHSLRDFLQESLLQKRKRKVVPISQKQKTVGSSTHYARITVAAEYLEFLARRIYPFTEDAGNRIAAMVAQIKANRPNQTTKTIGMERDDKHLDDSDLDALEAKLKPGAEENPFSGDAVQLRNSIIFSILRATGIRRGELLNLQVGDVAYQFDNGEVNPRPQIPPIVCLLLITISQHSFRSLVSDIVSLLALALILMLRLPCSDYECVDPPFATRGFVDNTLVNAAIISLPAAFSKDEV